jgi:hypothetical protein
LYQYDLRTGLFTSINANNIRNPFTSLGEEGAITDSLTLTTNVDWTVKKGKVLKHSEHEPYYYIIPGINLKIDVCGFIGGIICEDCLTENGTFDEEKCAGVISGMEEAGYTSEEIENMKNDFAECCGKNGGDVLKSFYGRETSSGQMLNITRCQIDKYDPSKDYYVLRVKL